MPYWDDFVDTLSVLYFPTMHFLIQEVLQTTRADLAFENLSYVPRNVTIIRAFPVKGVRRLAFSLTPSSNDYVAKNTPRLRWVSQ